MPLSGRKVFGIGDAEYKPSGQNFKGESLANRKKVNIKKLELIRAWKSNLKSTLRVGIGLDKHLDTAMRELIEGLQEWDETVSGGNNE